MRRCRDPPEHGGWLARSALSPGVAELFWEEDGGTEVSPRRALPAGAAGSVLLFILVEVLVVLVVLADARHRRLHPGPAILRPAGARGQRPVRAVGQVATRTGASGAARPAARNPPLPG